MVPLNRSVLLSVVPEWPPELRGASGTDQKANPEEFTWRKIRRDSYKAHNLPETSLSQRDSQYVTPRLQSLFNFSW